MKSSYRENDVVLLLKDISGLEQPLPTEEREKRIQNGTHYSEMLPLEYKPSDKYMKAYKSALKDYSSATAKAISIMAEKIFEEKGEGLVIVSLARAGIPIGVLTKRYIEKRHKIKVFHYSISIIRDKGIDKNAMQYILDRHDPQKIQFLDGWVGKGAIFRELQDALNDYPMINPSLAVVSDPANLTDYCGTHEDILIPSSCLNAVVTGLISRTFFRKDIIHDNDFHGAVYYSDLENEDLSYEFIETIERQFDWIAGTKIDTLDFNGMDVVNKISTQYKVVNINYIKPGIGETTRVLLRRIPWKILINSKYADSPELFHIIALAKEKKVDIEICPFSLGAYKACGIIRQLSDV